jgi:hypothetical protein|tara:strand:+ start:4578 stop:4718 length:141 start_codon:yes stop_codon:yes gene_type:complete
MGLGLMDSYSKLLQQQSALVDDVANDQPEKMTHRAIHPRKRHHHYQ